MKKNQNKEEEEHDLLCTSFKQKNDCHYKEVKIKLDINDLIKVRNSCPNNPIIMISGHQHPTKQNHKPERNNCKGAFRCVFR